MLFASTSMEYICTYTGETGSVGCGVSCDGSSRPAFRAAGAIAGLKDGPDQSRRRVGPLPIQEELTQTVVIGLGELAGCFIEGK